MKGVKFKDVGGEAIGIGLRNIAKDCTGNRKKTNFLQVVLFFSIKNY